MSTHPQTFLPILLATALFAPAAAPAANVGSFLEDVQFAENTSGVTNALAMVEARLRQNGLSAEEGARCRAREAELLARSGRHGEALDILSDKVITAPGVSAATKLAGVDIVQTEWTRPYSSLPKHQIFEIAALAARQPAFAQRGDARARLCLRLGRIHAGRCCHDLAVAAYREAAAGLEDPAGKVDAYFAAAASAQQYRDLKTAAACLAEAGNIPGLPTATRQRILLALARNASYRDQHSWQPSREQVAAARRYADQALQARSPLIGTAEALLARYGIARAEAAAGDVASAAGHARELIAHKTPLDGRTKGDIAVFIAENLHAAGDYKGAVEYYERAARTGCSLGLKNLHKRIAVSARAGRDYLRAMQGYSDAIKYCDKIEGKDEIAYLTRLVTQMNKTVRKAASSADAATIFSDAGNGLLDLDLDE
jgi:tetratricopeptide (TPR) repeat protein